MTEGVKIDLSSGLIVFAIISVFADREGILAFVIFAAGIHELAHFVTLSIVGGHIESVFFGLSGAVAMISDDTRISYGRELIAVTVGPLANIAAAAILSVAAKRVDSEWLYIASGVNLTLGLFNLLPLKHLDGGRILLLTMLITQPFERAHRLLETVSGGLYMILLPLSVLVWIQTGFPALTLSLILYLAGNLIKDVATSKKRPT